MPRPTRRFPVPLAAVVWLVATLALVGCLGVQDHAQPPASGPTTRPVSSEPVTWADLGPVVLARCATCHAAPGQAAGLDLTTPGAVREHITSGRLLQRVDSEADPMPPSGRLPDEVRRLFHQWAEVGFPDAPRGSEDDYAFSTSGTHSLRKETAAVTPYDVSAQRFDFLERMQGHWIGSMELMGQQMPWFAFDYRAIAPAHVHGIFEGGTMGNLMTSFFLARYRGVETLVARNGGILNGIYRTSYFILDRVEQRGGATTYRFVDAIGGADIMWMALTFEGDRLDFEAHTSRMGEQPAPTRHMKFVAQRNATDLAREAANAVGFPAPEFVLDLPEGFPVPDWGSFGPVTSASYMWQDRSLTYEQMGLFAADPVRIEHLTHLARLTLEVNRPPQTERAKLLVYLSREPFTDAEGRLRTAHGVLHEDLFDSLLLFPEITPSQDSMTFTYLHPGEYWLTVVADLDRDGLPGDADTPAASRRVTVPPGGHPTVHVDDLGANR